MSRAAYLTRRVVDGKMPPMDFDPEELRRVFSRQPVIAAYLFGSQVTGSTTALSDVDIAVLLRPDTPSRGLVQAELISDLMLVFGRSDVDVVLLHDASPLVKQRAISSGKLIYCVDDSARVRFEVATRRDYVETQHLRDVQDAAFLARYAPK